MDKSLEFFTVAEVADVLRLSPHRVYEIVRQGQLPSVRIGRQVRIESQAFNRWVADGGTAAEQVSQAS